MQTVRCKLLDIKILFICFLLFSSFNSFGQVATNPSQLNTKPEQNISKEEYLQNQKALREQVSVSFPQYQSTGNKELDDENYRIAKEAWISAHPDLYKKMNENGNLIVISEKEMSSFPENKRNEILAHPEKYLIK